MKIQELITDKGIFLLIEIPKDSINHCVNFGGMLFFTRTNTYIGDRPRFCYLPKKYSYNKEIIGVADQLTLKEFCSIVDYTYICSEVILFKDYCNNTYTLINAFESFLSLIKYNNWDLQLCNTLVVKKHVSTLY